MVPRSACRIRDADALWIVRAFRNKVSQDEFDEFVRLSVETAARAGTDLSPIEQHEEFYSEITGKLGHDRKGVGAVAERKHKVRVLCRSLLAMSVVICYVGRYLLCSGSRDRRGRLYIVLVRLLRHTWCCIVTADN